MIRAALVAAALACAAGAPAGAEPFVPTDDAQILETGLPGIDPRMREVRRLAAEFAAEPGDLTLAMRLAARQLAIGVGEADPRFVGYAQGTLARWWGDQGASPALRILRARILQARHDFAPAAADLRAALRDEPGSAEALLVLGSIQEVTGDLAEGRDACVRLAAVRPGLVAVACGASIDSLTGNAERAYAALTDAVEHMPVRDRSQLAWAMTILGEIAIRRGEAAAERHLKGALALDPRNIYALTVYADYLLDESRAADALRLLRGFERIDALYLRLALAAQALDDPQFPKYRADLAARFEVARRQSDSVHLRDAARFALEIEHDAARALYFARQNWATHKTPSDARLLLAAAIACHDPEAAKPALDRIAETGLEDRMLQRLAARLASGS